MRRTLRTYIIIFSTRLLCSLRFGKYKLYWFAHIFWKYEANLWNAFKVILSYGRRGAKSKRQYQSNVKIDAIRMKLRFVNFTSKLITFGNNKFPTSSEFYQYQQTTKPYSVSQYFTETSVNSNIASSYHDLHKLPYSFCCTILIPIYPSPYIVCINLIIRI